jgi:peptidoglycan/xylan/chitin deacetylase (PgdA/CDA1 family)
MALLFVWVLGFGATCAHAHSPVPILAYHRFGPVVLDAMTVTTAAFEAQLRYLAEHDRPVVSLRSLIEHRLGRGPAPPSGAVILTADDGHRSVYTEMYPIVRRFRVPVTLFVYPSAISRADYALTWEQLRELRASGLFDVGSHTWWHPNFRTEKQRLAPAEYERFVQTQLARSREILARELGGPIDLLAWPFGIYDRDLLAAATAAGYLAAVTLDGRSARLADDLLALPRYLITDRHRGGAFSRLLAITP